MSLGVMKTHLMTETLSADRILVWDKCHNGMGNLNDWGIGYEYIFLFKKGSPRIRGDRVNGVISYKHIGYFEKTVHPTQKPTGLIKLIILKSIGKEEGIVLDPFMGSGTTAVACKQLNKDFIGFEINRAYVNIANRRLSMQPESLEKWIS